MLVHITEFAWVDPAIPLIVSFSKPKPGLWRIFVNANQVASYSTKYEASLAAEQIVANLNKELATTSNQFKELQ